MDGPTQGLRSSGLNLPHPYATAPCPSGYRNSPTPGVIFIYIDVLPPIWRLANAYYYNRMVIYEYSSDLEIYTEACDGKKDIRNMSDNDGVALLKFQYIRSARIRRHLPLSLGGATFRMSILQRG